MYLFIWLYFFCQELHVFESSHFRLQTEFYLWESYWTVNNFLYDLPSTEIDFPKGEICKESKWPLLCLRWRKSRPYLGKSSSRISNMSVIMLLRVGHSFQFLLSPWIVATKKIPHHSPPHLSLRFFRLIFSASSHVELCLVFSSY